MDYRIKIAILWAALAVFVAAGIAALVLLSVVRGRRADSKPDSMAKFKVGGLILVLAVALRALVPALRWLGDWLRSH